MKNQPVQNVRVFVSRHKINYFLNSRYFYNFVTFFQKQKKSGHIQDDVEVIRIKRELRGKSQALVDLELKYEAALRQMEELATKNEQNTHKLQTKDNQLAQSLQSNGELKAKLDAAMMKSQLLPHKDVQIKNLKAEIETLKTANRELVASAFDQSREQHHESVRRSLEEKINHANETITHLQEENTRLKSELASESEKVALRTREFRETHAALLTSKSENEELSNKLQFFTRKSSVNLHEVEEALAIVRRRRENARDKQRLSFLYPIEDESQTEDSDGNDMRRDSEFYFSKDVVNEKALHNDGNSTVKQQHFERGHEQNLVSRRRDRGIQSQRKLKETISSLQAANADAYVEIDKLRRMLELEHRISQEYKGKTKEQEQAFEQQKQVYFEEMEELSKTADAHLHRVRQLEEKLRDLAYGTHQASISQAQQQPLHRFVDGGNATSEWGISLPVQNKGELRLNHEKTIDVARGDNVFEINIVRVELSEHTAGLLDTAIPSLFLTYDFFDFQTQATSVRVGRRPVFNESSTYIVTMNDVFIRYLIKDSLSLELHQAFGSTFETLAASHLRLHQFFMEEASANGQKKYMSCKFYSLKQPGLVIGTLYVWMRFHIPMERAMRLYRQKIRAQAFLQNPESATSLFYEHPPAKNSLTLSIISGNFTAWNQDSSPPSLYVAYQALAEPEFCTETARNTRTPSFHSCHIMYFTDSPDIRTYFETGEIILVVINDDESSEDNVFSADFDEERGTMEKLPNEKQIAGSSPCFGLARLQLVKCLKCETWQETLEVVDDKGSVVGSLDVAVSISHLLKDVQERSTLDENSQAAEKHPENFSSNHATEIKQQQEKDTAGRLLEKINVIEPFAASRKDDALTKEKHHALTQRGVYQEHGSPQNKVAEPIHFKEETRSHSQERHTDTVTSDSTTDDDDDDDNDVNVCIGEANDDQEMNGLNIQVQNKPGKETAAERERRIVADVLDTNDNVFVNSFVTENIPESKHAKEEKQKTSHQVGMQHEEGIVKFFSEEKEHTQSIPYRQTSDADIPNLGELTGELHDQQNPEVCSFS